MFPLSGYEYHFAADRCAWYLVGLHLQETEPRPSLVEETPGRMPHRLPQVSGRTHGLPAFDTLSFAGCQLVASWPAAADGNVTDQTERIVVILSLLYFHHLPKILDGLACAVCREQLGDQPGGNTKRAHNGQTGLSPILAGLARARVLPWSRSGSAKWRWTHLCMFEFLSECRGKENRR